MEAMVQETKKPRKKTVAVKERKPSGVSNDIVLRNAKVRRTKGNDASDNIEQQPDNNFDTYIQMVEKKAYALYEKRGRDHGRDMEDWFEAEKLVEVELCKP